MTPPDLTLILFVALGVIFIGVSIPLIRGKIGPNLWYGFRTPRTLRDPEIWYPVNAYAAWRMLWFGVAQSVAAVVLYFVPNLDPHTYAYSVLGVGMVGVTIVLILSFLYLHRLVKAKDAGERL